MLSTEQKAIIRQICENQEESFLEIVEQLSQRIYDELTDEGYRVSLMDISEEVLKKLEIWDQVRKDPDQFPNILDDQEIGMMKHHLINEYLGVEDTRDIWKKLNLKAKTDEFKN